MPRARRKCETAQSPSIVQVNGTANASKADTCTVQNTTMAAMVSKKYPSVEDLAFFLELFFFGWTEAGGGTQCFAVVVKRKIAHMQRERACRRLVLDDDRYRTAFDALTKRDAAAASEPRVSEPLGHLRWIISPDPPIPRPADF